MLLVVVEEGKVAAPTSATTSCEDFLLRTHSFLVGAQNSTIVIFLVFKRSFTRKRRRGNARSLKSSGTSLNLKALGDETLKLLNDP
jgi:hypothetical protein